MTDLAEKILAYKKQYPDADADDILAKDIGTTTHEVEFILEQLGQGGFLL